MDELLQKKNIPDAVFAVNDIVAMGAFRRIKEAGLRIPEDIAVMGFSNSHLTTMVSDAHRHRSIPVRDGKESCFDAYRDD